MVYSKVVSVCKVVGLTTPGGGRPCKLVGVHPRRSGRPSKVTGNHEKWSTFIPCGRLRHIRWAIGHPTSDKSKNLTS
ncbi:unnamed protein product [Prunus armeniaca]|uniref:Uncharacterized protein n=1 Tax=Prunus armeniaca TaxID=36596 RepID=A0A6J5UC93_PRUAR|nr:unnamed protein product [Prunus armeniaca]